MQMKKNYWTVCSISLLWLSRNGTRCSRSLGSALARHAFQKRARRGKLVMFIIILWLQVWSIKLTIMFMAMHQIMQMKKNYWTVCSISLLWLSRNGTRCSRSLGSALVRHAFQKRARRYYIFK